jgi:hypothetical protein
MSVTEGPISERVHAVWVHVRWVRITMVVEELPPGTSEIECRLYLRASGMPYWQRMGAMVASGLVLPTLVVLPVLASSALGGLTALVASLLLVATAFGLGMGATVLIRSEPRLLWGLVAIALLVILAAWFQPLAIAGCAVAALIGAMSQATEHWRRLDLSDRWWRLAAVLTLFGMCGLTLLTAVGAVLAALVAIVIGAIFAACAWVALKMSIEDSVGRSD